MVAIWERPPRAPADWTIDREAADATVRAAMEAYDVLELACDPPGWYAEINRWADAFGDAVVEYPTSVRARMAASCSRFYTAVMHGAPSPTTTTTRD